MTPGFLTKLGMVEEGFLECFARAEAVHIGGDGGVVALLLPLLGRQVNGILILDGKVNLKQISSLVGRVLVR